MDNLPPQPAADNDDHPDVRRILGVLKVGGDRETAAHIVGRTIGDLRHQLAEDSQFAARVRRAEAAAEITHMSNVYHAAREKEDWRASVWWLEHRDPDRFVRRSPNTLTTKQLATFMDAVANVLQQEIHDTEDRERVVQRIRTEANEAHRAARIDEE